MMSYMKFQDEVLLMFRGKLDHLSPSDLVPILNQIDRMKDRGFTVEDAVAYVRCIEDVNPDLDEDVALARMSEISKKYLP
jgi:hypothetical protein